MADERDFAILSHLRKDPFMSYENLGRAVWLSGRAVKTRLEALEKNKILTSLQAVPAAQVFRRQPRLFFFERRASPEKLNGAVELDPVVFATVDVNRSAAVLLYHRPGAPVLPRRLGALLGGASSEATPLYPHPRRELAKPVPLAELKVLRMLVLDLRIPLREISEATGLTQRVAKKARRRLVDDGLLQVQPIFQSARSSGILMYELHVHSSEPSVLSRLREGVPRSMFVNQWESGAIILSCWADSIQEVYEVEARLRREPGVGGVQVKFHARTVLATRRLSSWIDEEISQSENGRLSD